MYNKKNNKTKDQNYSNFFTDDFVLKYYILKLIFYVYFYSKFNEYIISK